MKFLLEQNLKKTGRWLRFFGCDVVIVTEAVNQKILQKHSDRIFITTSARWKEIAQRRRLPVLLVPREQWKEQLCLIVKTFEIKAELKLNLCSSCGSELLSVSKELVKGSVPHQTFSFHQEFYRCPTCEKIYWEGSHYERMQKRLEEVIGEC